MRVSFNYSYVYYGKFFIDFILIVLYRVISVRILKVISCVKDMKLKCNDLLYIKLGVYVLERYLIKDVNILLNILLLCFKEENY